MHNRAVDPTPLAVTSLCGSYMTSCAYRKLTACSLATVPSLKENMTKTQVKNCVAIDATTEQGVGPWANPPHIELCWVPPPPPPPFSEC